MEKIDRLCDALLLYAKGCNPTAMPKVSYHFSHDGSDLPELGDSWKLDLVLTGVDRLEGSQVVTAYEHRWEGTGPSSEAAFHAVFKQVRTHMDDRRMALAGETAALDTTITAFDAPDLKTLWANKDPEEHPVEAFKALTGEAGRAST